MENQIAKKIESPAWQNMAPGNEQNDSVKAPANETIKTGGNSRSAEDDLDLDKLPDRKGTVIPGQNSMGENSRTDLGEGNEDPKEDPMNK